MEKITQIINAPKNLFARFLQEDGTMEELPIICTGVCENGELHYIVHSADAVLCPVTDYSDFNDVIFK